MLEEIIKEKLTKAIKLLLEKDRYLLENSINELSITHKLAEYLQKQFRNYNVDCEYNGNKINEINKIIKNTSKTLIFNNLSSKKVYPDIIVHKRGDNENNLLVIEVKKSCYFKQKDKYFDIEKLKLYTEKTDENPYGYKYGVFLKFKTNTDTPSLLEDIWFQNGDEKTEITNSISEDLKNN